MAHCYFRVCFHHNKQYKKANIVNNISVVRDSDFVSAQYLENELMECIRMENGI